MVFAMPEARSVLRGLSQSELHALAAQQTTARATDYGAVNIQTQVLARSKASTFIVLGRRPRASRTRRSPATSGERVSAELQDAYIAEQEMVAGRRLHRQRPRVPRPRAPLHRGGQRQHRGHAAAPLLRRRRRATAFEPELTVIYTPNLGVARLPGRPADRGRPRERRHPRLQLRLLRRVEEGRPAHVEQARLRPRRPAAARRLQGHPDRRRATGVGLIVGPLGHRQDDDHVHQARTARCRCRTTSSRGGPTATCPPPRPAASPRRSRSQPEDEPTIHGAVTQARGLPRERLAGRRRQGRLLRHELHAERPRDVLVLDDRGRRRARHRRRPTSC